MNKKNTKWVLFILVLIVFSILLLNYFLLYNKEDRGTFGDMYGPSNAFFSGLAFIGVIYTILLQKEDLNKTKEELKRHQFESNLNNSINAHLKIVEQLNLKVDKDNYVKGREVFREIYESKSKNAQSLILLTEEDDLDHYFNNIYRILKTISRFDGIKEDAGKKKYQYSNLLRSVLSTYELKCILSWSVQEKGSSLLKYTNEFSFFKNLPKVFKDVSFHQKLESTAFYPKDPKSN